jgi:hypothetical protein
MSSSLAIDHVNLPRLAEQMKAAKLIPAQTAAKIDALMGDAATGV